MEFKKNIELILSKFLIDKKIFLNYYKHKLSTSKNYGSFEST